MKRRLIIVLALFLFLSCQHSKPPPAPSSIQNEDNFINPNNYCHDQESWAEWEELVRKCPDDSDLQALHALRIGLCIKIEQGSVSLEDAINIFDQAHQEVIERARQRSEGKKPST